MVHAGLAQPASPDAAAAAAHVAHKIPSGDGPYARAKHYQVIKLKLSIDLLPASRLLAMHSPAYIQHLVDFCS